MPDGPVLKCRYAPLNYCDTKAASVTWLKLNDQALLRQFSAHSVGIPAKLAWELAFFPYGSEFSTEIVDS